MKTYVTVECPKDQIPTSSDAAFWDAMLGDDTNVLTFLQEAELLEQKLRASGQYDIKSSGQEFPL